MRSKLYSALILGLIAFMGSFLLFTIANAEIQEKQIKIEGRWQGALSISGMKMRLVFHISSKPNGQFTAMMDSPDQGVKGIPVSKVTLTETNVRFEVPSVFGVYEGKVNQDGSIIKGRWSQGGQSFAVDLERSKEEKDSAKPETMEKPIPEAEREKILGIWQGVLKVSGVELRIVFKISENEEGLLEAKMDSPDQGVKDIPVSKVVFMADSMRLEVPTVAGFYVGKLQPAQSEFAGTWHQGGRSFTLDVKRIDKLPEVKRPQEPEKPYPYDEQDVTYENKEAGVELAGTLTLPRTGGPFPAVLLITGSGPQDRNETVMGHKPFWILADYLTRNGIAVLRSDDRGTGKSTGKFAGATSEDFASDALAGVAYLKNRKEINPEKIGLIGHSEGGIIAPMVATQSSDVAFIVLLAGTGIPGEQIMYLQKALILKSMGASQELIEFDHQISEHIFTKLKKEKDNTIVEQQIRDYFAQKLNQTNEQLRQEIEKFGDPEKALEVSLKMYLSPWFRFFLTYDPAPTLKKVTCPVLALNGEKDYQVPPRVNLNAIEKALTAGGNSQFSIQVLPNLNHLFQTAETGSPSEYAKIEETMSPTALKIVNDWIISITKRM